MAFQEIKPLPKPEELFDIAVKRANKAAGNVKQGKNNRLNFVKDKELLRLRIIRETIVNKLDKILCQFPKEGLSDFYKELLDITVGAYELKKVLNDVLWVRKQIYVFYKEYKYNIKTCRNIDDIGRTMKSYYGRIASILDNVDFKFLENTRKAMQSFPIIKTKFKQVAIAGFPNVGKTTLLSKLSGSTPEIANYAFTTKGIMIGYVKDVQLLDTPGALNRFNKMNYIEKQAFLIMKMVAQKIVYVFDLTEEYPLEDQIKLYERILEFGKPVVIYLSKTDILEEEKVKDFKKRYKDAITDIEELVKAISAD